METTANDAVLKDISFVKLSTRREKQILLYYYKIMFGMVSPTLHPLISKMYKDLSPYMLRNSLNDQIPLTEKNILFNRAGQPLYFENSVATATAIAIC